MYNQSPGRMNMPKTGRDIPTNMVNPIMQIDPRSGRRKAYGIFEDIPASAYQESESTSAYDNLAKHANYDLGNIYKH